jgi:hypothetical protein
MLSKLQDVFLSSLVQRPNKLERLSRVSLFCSANYQTRLGKSLAYFASALVTNIT